MLQTALRTERDSLQQQLSQAKNDLEAARTGAGTDTTTAVASSDKSAPAALTDAERAELQTKIKTAEDEAAAYKTVSLTI